MDSFRLIIFVGLLAGVVLSDDAKKCPKNEIWKNCGTCEGHCYNRNPICTKECKKPGCYCPLEKGFVRFGYTGACIPVSQCPNKKPPVKCGANEEYADCGCDQHCEPQPPCPPVCRRNCYCKKGYIRGWDGKCILKKQCTVHPECAHTTCPAGTHCAWTPKWCITTPCPQVSCIPNAKNETCGVNEFWNKCGGCDKHCEDPGLACPAVCREQCSCKPGYVRDWDGKCINPKQCTAHPDCK
ncbi:hypothetical protein L596_013872 [Steinernema carpocapsae]|uniref:TIL domain-containing protein n=1 Tax=Steinernema carpocapsae TaxID=34508 RepID=A0A4U5P1G5_STECR|nr:hypothetical protein L596_013872 [Steinernema carpocapsae]